jgi:type IV secretion system protein VirB8
MSLEDRFVNPLGFQVLRYRRDAETLAAEPQVPPQSLRAANAGPPPAAEAPQPAPVQVAPAPPARPEPEL